MLGDELRDYLREGLGEVSGGGGFGVCLLQIKCPVAGCSNPASSSVIRKVV